MTWPTHIVAVAGLVEDSKGNVLLAKSTHRKSWEFNGGQVEIGENLEEALVREIKEETGINVTVRCLVGLYSNIQQSTWYDGVTPVPTKLMLDFLCDYVSGEPTTSDETTEVIWCPREQALDMITLPAYRLRMQNLLSFSGQVFYHAYSTKPFEEHYSRMV
ncbi:MAG: NUDIX hydrolase [Bacillota bacterium]|nr:MAG: NUDIX hydrolase [Bacillota bacterium]